MRTVTFEEVKAATLTVVHRVGTAPVKGLLLHKFNAKNLRQLDPHAYLRFIKAVGELIGESAE